MSDKKFWRFNTKYLKTGGYSVLVSVVAIAIIIVINLFVNKLPKNVTQYDMTLSDLYSISEETEKTVKGVTEDIKIYFIWPHGTAEDESMVNILEKYAELNDHIEIERIDPTLRPSFFVDDRKELMEGDVVVESAKRSKNINYVDVMYGSYSMEYLYSYYNQYGTYPPPLFDAEEYLTAAIKYVTTDKIPVIYALTGHGEEVLSDEVVEANITNESMVLQTLNIASAKKIPADCGCIMIYEPSTDILEEEKDILLDYLKSGGNMMYISHFNQRRSGHPNLDSVLAYYGLSAGEGYVVETDSDRMKPGLVRSLYVPDFGDHTITKPFVGMNMYVTDGQAISSNKSLRNTLTITPLFTTSSVSFTDLNGNSTLDEGEVKGPFDVAVAAEEKNADGTVTRIVWQNVYPESGDFLTNSFGWMCQLDSAISMPAKDTIDAPLEINETTSTILTWIFAVIIPLSVVGVGVYVLYRRRSK